MATTQKNFWLWGTWGKRIIPRPFLTQKISGKIRDVVIGQTFIIALKEDGKLFSWGEDKQGCLGLGTDCITSHSPKQINLGTEGVDPVLDIQYGKHHVLALTQNGKVYSWGDNQSGQLGLGDTQTRYEPQPIEDLKPYTVMQILAVDGMSYALTSHGQVYAWGENKEGALALEHDNGKVLKPEPMTRMRDTNVKKLLIKDCGSSSGVKAGKTIIALVEMADPIAAKDQIGGFDGPLGHADPQPSVIGVEQEIFLGVDMMRRVMDNTQDWWHHMLSVRHGSPYDDNPTHYEELTDPPVAGDNCTTIQLDTFASLDKLEKASYELDMLIQSAKAQMLEIKKMKGTKNVRFMLAMFMDDCKLRREKIRRTVAARQLMEQKKGLSQSGHMNEGNKNDEARLTEASNHLTKVLQKVRNLKQYDVFTRALQDSIVECIECKIQVHEYQSQRLKHVTLGTRDDVILPCLRKIKERWGALKHFSIYNLYQECNLRGQNVTFESDDEMLAFLVQSSDSKIDQIISQDRNQMVTRDLLVPGLCYDLLKENAELRKMCNTYQLKVLLMREGKEKAGAPPTQQTAALALTNGKP